MTVLPGPLPFFQALSARAAMPDVNDDKSHPQITVVVNNTDDQDHWSGLRRDKLLQAAMSHKAA